MEESQKLCECGCGRPAPIATRNRTEQGWIKGQPIRFIHGHSSRKYRHDSPEYSANEAGCWIWGRTLDPFGYGVTSGGKRAHRVLYEQCFGAIPSGILLHHLCHNTSCVNPAHLKAMTTAEHQRLRRDGKLSAADVRQIRASTDTGVAVARQFGISTAMVSLVRSGKRWTE